MSKTAPRLGRGLSALVNPQPAPLASGATAVPAPAQTVDGQVQQLPIEWIRRNTNQPRTHFDPEALAELAASIRTRGILQPVLVRPVAPNQYELVAGERRWRAAQAAGLQVIPALVRSVSPAESQEIALIENLQREDLNALERAEAYHRYMETFGITPDDLAQRLGESRSNIVNYVRLLKLQSEVRQLLASGVLSMGHARALAGVSDPQRQLGVARLVVRRQLSVRQTEALAQQTAKGGDDSDPSSKPLVTVDSKAGAASRHLAEVERALSQSLGMPVRIVAGRGKNRGRVVIAFRNLEEFDRLAERLGGSATLIH